MDPRLVFDRLAQTIQTGGETSVWSPRQPRYGLTKATVTGVNQFRGHVDLSFAAPPGATPGTAQSVYYLQSYGPTHQPEEDHTVFVQWIGNQPIVMGQHLVTSDLVML
jgi:hypothetical protein